MGLLRRSLDITLNRDRDYPRFPSEYFRTRWSWRTMLTNESDDRPFGIYEGRAAFAVTGLLKAHAPRLFGKRVDDRALEGVGQ